MDESTGHVLVTGASGRIGGAFVRRPSRRRPVVCLFRDGVDDGVAAGAAR